MLWMAVALAGAEDWFPEMDRCLEAGNHTQLAINMCSARGARVADAYHDAISERIGWMGDEVAFDKATQAFVTFRDKRCDRLGSAWEGGSGQPMVIHGCRMTVTRHRTVALEGLANNTPPSQSYEEADAALNTMWRKVWVNTDKELLAVQRAWLVYRDAQCAWARSRAPESESACKTVLTQHRTQQLVHEGEP